MPTIKHVKTNLTVPNSPNDPVAYGIIALDQKLSKHYSKNIRQGHSFKVKSMQATIIPSDGLLDDWDTGATCNVRFEYVAPTKYPVKAWNEIFQVWLKQKRLASAGIQGQTRYDDFEVGWSTSAAYSIGASRGSRIYSSGVTDDTSEGVYLLGSSTSGSDFCLQDYANSNYDALPTPTDHFGNVTYKPAKFDTNNVWPSDNRSEFWISATASNNVHTETTPDSFSSSFSSSNLLTFEHPHNVMCGLMAYQVYIPINDTLGQWADTFDLHLSITVESWKPLVYRPRRRKARRTTRRKSSARRGHARKRSRR